MGIPASWTATASASPAHRFAPACALGFALSRVRRLLDALTSHSYGACISHDKFEGYCLGHHRNVLRQEPAKYKGDGKAPYVEQYPLNRAKQFELEHPEPGLAYVRHPKRSRRLLPLATYHPSILAEKTTEAINMLTWLGASQIDVSYSSKISDQAKADLEIFFGLLKVTGEKGSEETNRFIYRARGVGAPPRELPDLVWTEEPGWRV